VAFTRLDTDLPNFDKWVELREVAAPNKSGPAVFTIQDGRSVRFLYCRYTNEGTVEVKTLAILNADRATYEWQNI
jgi:hypothetical protein